MGALAGNSDLVRKLLERDGLRALRTDSLGRLAQALDVSLDELARALELTDAPPERPRGAAPDQLAIAHECQAGAWIESALSEAQAFETANVLLDPAWPPNQWLERVRGDSVNLIAPEGSLLQVVDWKALQLGAPRDGQMVVLERIRHQGGLRERSVKVTRFVPGKPLTFWPASSNPRWQEPLPLSAKADEAGAEISVRVQALVIWVHRPAPNV